LLGLLFEQKTSYHPFIDQWLEVFCVISMIFFVTFFVSWCNSCRTVALFNKSPVGGNPSCFTKKNRQ
jgi:hypothetical protein